MISLNEDLENKSSPWTEKLKTLTATSTEPLYRGFDVVAIDPGVNFGMTVLTASDLRIYYGKLLKQEKSAEYAWLAFGFIRDTLLSHQENCVFVLEGAAYNKIYGQVGLADVRTGFYLGARSVMGAGSILTPAPMSARKVVFGNGRHQASDDFPQLDHNAADSVGLALYGCLAPPMRSEAEGS